jgi:hypothetical protein
MPVVKRLFVTDQRGGNDVVIDATTDLPPENRSKLKVGIEAGSANYEPDTH